VGVTSYRTIAQGGLTELEVGGSRFSCALTRVADEEDARSVLERARRTHWDARHHCVGWVLGPDGAIEHAGDEGEPLGTGGAPILGELRGRDLSDVVAVVSRWSGDSLLGPDVLSRAYGEVTRTALDDVGVLERVLQDLCEVEVDIAEVGRLEHDLRSRGARVLGVEYTGEALLRFAVPPRARAVVDEIVADLTGGRAASRVIGQEWVDSAA
jgi:putative IMPACT (imprinted ancient) family translation regulator